MYLVAPQTVRPEQRSYTSYHVIDSSSASRVVLETSNPASWTFRGFSWTDRQFYATRIAQMGVICASIPLCSCLIMDLPVPEATLHLILMFRLDEWMPFEKPRRSFQLSLQRNWMCRLCLVPATAATSVLGTLCFTNWNWLVHRVTMTEQNRTQQRQLRY